MADYQVVQKSPDEPFFSSFPVVLVSANNMSGLASQAHFYSDKEDVTSICSSLSHADSGVGSGNSSPRSAGRSSHSPRRRSQGLNFDFLATKVTFSGIQKEEKELQQIFAEWQTAASSPPSSDMSGFTVPREDAVESGSWQTLVKTEGLTKDQADHQEATWELVTTELAYIRNLETICSVHMPAFDVLSDRALSWFQCDTNKIFGNLEELLMANTRLWKDCFGPFIKNADGGLLDASCPSLYNGFMKIEEYFEPYIEFCTNYHNLQSYYNSQWANSEHFRSVIEWLVKQSTDRLVLSSWMMKPVQRVMRYHILLNTIWKKAEDPYQKIRLQAMISSVENFVHRINARVKDIEDKEILCQIYERIAGYNVFDKVTDEVSELLKQYSLVENHKLEGRKFIREFDVKVKRVDEPFKRTDGTLFIFSDTVMLCRKSWKKHATSRVKIFRPPIPVLQIQIHPLRETASFLLVILDELKTVTDAHVIYARNPAQMDSLNACIQKAAEELEAKKAKITINRQPKNFQLTLSSTNGDAESSLSPDLSDNEETSTDPDPVPLAMPENGTNTPTNPKMALCRTRSSSANDLESLEITKQSPSSASTSAIAPRSKSFNGTIIPPRNRPSETGTNSSDTATVDHLPLVQDETAPKNERTARRLEISEIIRETNVQETEVSDLDEAASQTSDHCSNAELQQDFLPNYPLTKTAADMSRRGSLSARFLAKTSLGHVNSIVLKRQNGFRNAKKDIHKLKRYFTDSVTSQYFEKSPLTVAYHARSQSESCSDSELLNDDIKQDSASGSKSSSKSGSSNSVAATPPGGSKDSLTVPVNERMMKTSYNSLSSGIGSDSPDCFLDDSATTEVDQVTRIEEEFQEDDEDELFHAQAESLFHTTGAISDTDTDYCDSEINEGKKFRSVLYVQNLTWEGQNKAKLSLLSSDDLEETYI